MSHRATSSRRRLDTALHDRARTQSVMRHAEQLDNGGARGKTWESTTTCNQLVRFDGRTGTTDDDDDDVPARGRARTTRACFRNCGTTEQRSWYTHTLSLSLTHTHTPRRTLTRMYAHRGARARNRRTYLHGRARRTQRAAREEQYSKASKNGWEKGSERARRMDCSTPRPTEKCTVKILPTDHPLHTHTHTHTHVTFSLPTLPKDHITLRPDIRSPCGTVCLRIRWP